MHDLHTNTYTYKYKKKKKPKAKKSIQRQMRQPEIKLHRLERGK